MVFPQAMSPMTSAMSPPSFGFASSIPLSENLDRLITTAEMMKDSTNLPAAQVKNEVADSLSPPINSSSQL